MIVHRSKVALKIGVVVEIDTESHPDDITIKEFKRLLAENAQAYLQHMDDEEIIKAMSTYEILNVETYDNRIYEPVEAFERGFGIKGSPPVVKEVINEIREAYDESGKDMGKILGDVIFSLERELEEGTNA
jgi:hypothetical protein